MKDVNVVLSAVIVVAAVVIALMLGVRSWNSGADLGAGWASLLVFVFGAALGVQKTLGSKAKDKEGGNE